MYVHVWCIHIYMYINIVFRNRHPRIYTGYVWERNAVGLRGEREYSLVGNAKMFRSRPKISQNMIFAKPSGVSAPQRKG